MTKNAPETFLHGTATLDEALAEARSTMSAAGVQITDRSNPSGFDKSGYPCLMWSRMFTREVAEGAVVQRCSCGVTFLDQGTPAVPLVEVSWTAERFQRGKESHFVRKDRSHWKVEELSGERLGHRVLEALRRAQQALER